MQRLVELFNRYSRSFGGRAAIVLAGSVAGQALIFLLLPFVTRLYAVDALGRAATTLAFLSMAALVLFLQYDQALIVASDQDLPYLLLLCLLISLGWLGGLALLLGLAAWLLPEGLAWLDSLGMNVLLLPLVATYSPFVLFTNYHLRNNALGRVSLGRMLYYGGGAIFQVAGGWLLGASEATYLTAQTAAALLAILSLAPWGAGWRWLARAASRLAETSSEVRRVANAYSKFPKYQTLAQFLNAVSVNMTVIFMRVAFSAEWAGWYFIAWRILAAPTTLISQAVGQVFYRDSAEQARGGREQGRSVESMVYGLIRVSLLPAIALALLAPGLVGIFLGADWLPVATILQVLLIAFMIAFFVSPISNLLNVKEKQEKILFYYTLLFVGRLAALGVGWFFQTDIGSVWIYSLASVLILIPFAADVITEMGGSLMNVVRRLLPALTDAGLLLLAAGGLALAGWLDQPGGALAAAGLLALAAWREFRRGGWGVRKITSHS